MLWRWRGGGLRLRLRLGEWWVGSRVRRSLGGREGFMRREDMVRGDERE